MGNCLSLGGGLKISQQRESDGLVVDTRRRSFSKRMDMWEKTGTVAFRQSQLKEFPPELKRINPKKVRLLDGSKNKLTDIPPYVKYMVYCNRLGLSQNRIRSVPDEIGRMESLRVLLLDHNRIAEVPDSLFHLAKLERLSLSHNQLTRLPRGVAHLQQLKYIDISNNKIRSISGAIAGCRMLEELRCCDNMITKLPVDLAKLEKLRIIVAENNRIETVPSAIFMYCESLQTLALHGNPVEMKDIESVEGYQEFEERRKRLYDKAVSAGVLLGKQEEPASRTVLTMSNVTSE